MENPVSMSNLNDFIFCPASIYFQIIEGKTENIMFKTNYQLSGLNAHSAVDNKNYSKDKNILQSIEVYCDRYNLYGKIDAYDIKKKTLTERKKKVNVIYDGYIFQLYGQYFALKEMGYDPQILQIYSYSDNKMHKIKLPEEDEEMFLKFVKVICDISTFNFDSFKQTNED